MLIFSQFKIMLNVLEDYLRLMKFPLERIDGSVSQRDRETAINRFSAGLHEHVSAQNPSPIVSSRSLHNEPQVACSGRIKGATCTFLSVLKCQRGGKLDRT